MVRTITHAGDYCYYYPNRRRDGVRPVLLKKTTDKIKNPKVKKILLPNDLEVKVAFFGEYPQKSVKVKLSELLEGKRFYWARTAKTPYLTEAESQKVVETLKKLYTE